jgi:hypothetical protein
MKRHQISIGELEGYKVEHVLASSCGRGPSKRLAVVSIVPKCTYVVYCADVEIFSSDNLQSAVTAYNQT